MYIIVIVLTVRWYSSNCMTAQLLLWTEAVDWPVRVYGTVPRYQVHCFIQWLLLDVLASTSDTAAAHSSDAVIPPHTHLPGQHAEQHCIDSALRVDAYDLHENRLSVSVVLSALILKITPIRKGPLKACIVPINSHHVISSIEPSSYLFNYSSKLQQLHASLVTLPYPPLNAGMHMGGGGHSPSPAPPRRDYTFAWLIGRACTL